MIYIHVYTHIHTQIDSHMRFRYGWDTYSTSLLRALRSSGRSAKPILTTYPLGYTLPDNVPKDTRPTLLLPARFDGDGVLRQEGKVVKYQQKVPLSAPGTHDPHTLSAASVASQCTRSPLCAPDTPLFTPDTLCTHTVSAPVSTPDTPDTHTVRAALVASQCILSPLWASGFSFAFSSVLHEVPYVFHDRYAYPDRRAPHPTHN